MKILQQIRNLFDSRDYSGAYSILSGLDDNIDDIIKDAASISLVFRVTCAANDWTRASGLINDNFSALSINGAFGPNEEIANKHSQALIFKSKDDFPIKNILHIGWNCGVSFPGNGEVHYHMDPISKVDMKRLCRLHHVFTKFASESPNKTGFLILCVGDVSETEGPVMCPCTNMDSNILVPDPIYMGVFGYRPLKEYFQSRAVRWNEREPLFFWRGSSTGGPKAEADWRDAPRFRLCALGKAHTDCDFGISSVVQYQDPGVVSDIEKSGLLRAEQPIKSLDKYKYNIDIDGNSNSWPGLYTKLLAGGLVLKVASAYGYKQWYYDQLIPWENFVPIESDLSNFEQTLMWVRSHDVEAENIAKASSGLAANLCYEASLSYFMVRIEEAMQRSAGGSDSFRHKK